MCTISNLVRDIIGLIYPAQCISCKKKILNGKDVFCIECFKRCSVSDSFQYKENEIQERLRQRVRMSHGAALYNLTKDSIIRNAVHAIKYSGRRDLARAFGTIFGKKLMQAEHFNSIDYIVPVPIHQKRLKKRGYNQSLEFAKGISKITSIKILDDCLMKVKHVDTLTRKSRENRFQQVLNSFEVYNAQQLRGKSILMVDDVLTTGATIEAAYQKLIEFDPKEIYLGFICLAN